MNNITYYFDKTQLNKLIKSLGSYQLILDLSISGNDKQFLKKLKKGWRKNIYKKKLFLN